MYAAHMNDLIIAVNELKNYRNREIRKSINREIRK